MKKFILLLIVLFIGSFSLSKAEYVDVNNLNNRVYDFKMPQIKTPKFEVPKFDPNYLKKTEQKLRNIQAKSRKKIKKLRNTNLLIDNQDYKKNEAFNGEMLMTSSQNVNIDVQKIPFENKVSVYRINDVNPRKNDGNPGGRGVDELIVYTPEYGLKTNTNEYGKEAIVLNNKVAALSAMDSIIPLNGFVISGHGKARDWIEKNIILGARVDINRTTMTVSSIITPETYIFEAQEKIKEAKEINCYFKNQRYQMNQSDFYLAKAITFCEYAKRAFKSFDIIMVKKYAHNSIVYSNRAIACSVPYSSNEFKGVWLRPQDKDPKKISRILDNLQDSGIDNIFLETYYHGMTIFPSNTTASYGMPSQNPKFAGSDVLKIWLELAHKRNMKVHVWFQTFYVGNDTVSPVPKYLRMCKSDWLNRQYWFAQSEYVQPSKAEHLGYFLDPANPEVQTYLINLLKEIATKYEVDGINIDYIRYPVCSPENSSEFLPTSWGYTKYAMEEFKNCCGISPLNLCPNKSAWCKWEQYRKNKVTSFVERLQELKLLRQDIMLSAVIFPDKEQSAVIKLQDWSQWAKKGYFDALTPLFLSSNIEFTKKYLRDIKDNKSSHVKVYAGLFEPFTLVDPTVLIQEIKASREEDADGIIIFDHAHLSEPYQQILTVRAFNKNKK